MMFLHIWAVVGLPTNYVAQVLEETWGGLAPLFQLRRWPLEDPWERHRVDIFPHCPPSFGRFCPYFLTWMVPTRHSALLRPLGFSSPASAPPSQSASPAHYHSSGFIQLVAFQSYVVYLFPYFLSLSLSSPSQYKLYNSKSLIFFHSYISTH